MSLRYIASNTLVVHPLVLHLLVLQPAVVAQGLQEADDNDLDDRKGLVVDGVGLSGFSEADATRKQVSREAGGVQRSVDVTPPGSI